MQITCPSGLAGEIRKLKVKEENVLAYAKKMRRGAGLDEVLAAVWLSTTEKGLYQFETVPNWSKVLMGDHFYATIYMRIASIGPIYDFRVQCSNQFCREPFEWELDLSKLPVQMLSKRSREIFENDNRFEATLSSGKRVWFKLLLADVQQKFLRMKRDSPDKLATAALRMQIIEIEGIEKKHMNEFLDEMDSDEAMDLREQFDDAGCGIETEIEIECPTCDTISEIELPFGGRDFFSRRKKRIQAKAARMESQAEA